MVLSLSDEPTQYTLLRKYFHCIYVVSGMPSLGDSYEKALFATLERQLVASLEVSGWEFQ